MTENKRETTGPAPRPPDAEQRGIVTDVVVPIVSGAAGGAAGAYVTNVMQSKPSDPAPPEPPPPSIELPPGVDGE